MASQETTNVLIIGGGPAGYTAAIYAARAGLNPILYQGPEPGGQLTTTTDVENYPGYPKGVLGPQMMEDFKAQAQRFGADIRTGIVTAIDPTYPPHRIIVDHKITLLAKTVIIATGASAKWLGLPNEERLKGKGISSCAVCDGFFFKGQEVAVVGGGDSAAEEALYLAKLCKKVYMLVRRDKMRASHIMQQRILKTKNITLMWQTQVKNIIGKDTLESIEYLDNKTQTTSILPLQGLFVAIGHQPNTQLFHHITKDKIGYIQTKSPTTHTNIPGIFAAGDVQDYRYRQAITAAGTGCMAALDAERFLVENA